MTPRWAVEQEAALRDWHMASLDADTPGEWSSGSIREYLMVQRRCRALGVDLEDLRMWRIRQEQT